MSISDPNTLERELRPLKALKDEYPKCIITYDRYMFDDIDGIRVVQVVDWLMESRIRWAGGRVRKI